MPAMTPKLQEAYNEWLLKFGYREVPLAGVRADKLMLNNSEITNYKDWQRCVIYNDNKRIFKLRTLDEIEIYDKNDAKTTRSL